MFCHYKPLCVNFTSVVNEVAAKSFDSNADLYQKVRPSYPVESVESMLSFAKIPTSVAAVAEASKHGKKYAILDLAAGSGLFTNVLQEHIATTCNKNDPLVEISAVEPAAGMRTVFSQELPTVPIYDGTSTSLPFPDNHFDLVTVAQAFHWFANQQTLAEIHRVLKKDGRGALALIWNLESPEMEWMKHLRALYEPYDADVPQYRKGDWEEMFQVTGEQKTSLFELPITRKKFQTEMLVTQAHMMNRVESKSYITALSTEELDNLKQKMHRLLHEQYDKEFHLSVTGTNRKAGTINTGEAYAKHLLDVDLVLTKTLSIE